MIKIIINVLVWLVILNGLMWQVNLEGLFPFGSLTQIQHIIITVLIIGYYFYKNQKKQAEEQARLAKKSKAEANRKKNLIKKYGEKDGTLIFNKKITEKKYLKNKAEADHKKNLIKKYGEKDGTLIFNKKITEKKYLKNKAEADHKKNLIKKYGEIFGLAVFEKKVQNGMSLGMVEDVIGKHNYKEANDYYFGKPFSRKIVFNKDKLVEDKTFKDNIWLDMPLAMLIASWGNPGDKKESVTKSSVKQRLYFNGRINRQGGTSYEYQVDVENDLVVGWKELE